MKRRMFLMSCGTVALTAGCLSAGSPDDPTVTCKAAKNRSRTDARSPSGETWPTFQYDVRNTGYAPRVHGPTGCVKKRWQHKIDKDIRTSPVVADGTVYVGGYEKTLYALDAKTGEERWHYDGHDGLMASPTLADGTVYFATGATMQAVDIHTQHERWAFHTPNAVKPTDGVSSAPKLVDRILYFGSRDGTVYAVDAQTGEKQWQHVGIDRLPHTSAENARDSNFPGSVAVADGTVFAGSEDGYLYVLEAKTGAKRWRFRANDQVHAAPTVADGTIYVPSRDGHLYAISMTDHTVRWKFEYAGKGARGAGVMTSSAVANGVVYTSTGMSVESMNLFALNARNGSIKWKIGVSGPDSGPCLAGDTVYIGDHRFFIAIDAKTGTERWNLKTTNGIATTAAVANGAVYTTDVNGYVYGLW